MNYFSIVYVCEGYLVCFDVCIMRLFSSMCIMRKAKSKCVVTHFNQTSHIINCAASTPAHDNHMTWLISPLVILTWKISADYETDFVWQHKDLSDCVFNRHVMRLFVLQLRSCHFVSWTHQGCISSMLPWTPGAVTMATQAYFGGTACCSCRSLHSPANILWSHIEPTDNQLSFTRCRLFLLTLAAWMSLTEHGWSWCRHVDEREETCLKHETFCKKTVSDVGLV